MVFATCRPTSPPKLARMTLAPAYSKSRPIASPTMEVYKCPTWRTLKGFGSENSQIMVWFWYSSHDIFWPKFSAKSVIFVEKYASGRLKLRKPGGVIVMSATSSGELVPPVMFWASDDWLKWSSRRLFSSSAICIGFWWSALASFKGVFVE